MRYLAAVLTLLCGSAHATNVFYYPVIDQLTGLPNVLYLTDESSNKCPNYMMVARLETDDKKVLNTLCWARDRNNLENTLLLNLSNGQITSNYIPYGISKGAGDAYRAIMKKWFAENEAATDVLNSCEFLRSRGLTCDPDYDEKKKDGYGWCVLHQEECAARNKVKIEKANREAAARNEIVAQEKINKKERDDRFIAESKKQNNPLLSVLRFTPAAPLLDLFPPQERTDP